MKKVRITRTATTVTELEIDETKSDKYYGYESLEELAEEEKQLKDGDFMEAFVTSAEVNGLTSQECKVEIVDG